MWLHLKGRRISYVTVALLSIAFAGCFQVNKFNHEPTMAGRKAQQFADLAFVERNLQAAYDLLTQKTRSGMPLEQFKDVVSKMHPSQYPSSVEAIEYEPLMGPSMNIYLLGQARDEHFYYRLVMEGTKENDYKVAGLWRSDDPYPPSNMRKRLN